MRFAGLLAIALLAGCQQEDPRIAAAEDAAEATCACNSLVCAIEAAEFFTDQRGLEQEDYANLSEDLITRYQEAQTRAMACVRANILE